MGYGGKQASRSGDVRRFNFTGNGSNTAFDLGFTPASPNQLIVTVNGVIQHYDAFSLTGSTMTFTGTPAAGDAIQVTAVVDAVGVTGIPDGAVANVSTLTVSGNATIAGALTTSTNTTTLGTALYVVANGDVGLGTSTPIDTNGYGSFLDIYSTTGGAVYFHTSNANNYAWLGKYNSSTQLADSGAAGITFATANGATPVERMRIAYDGTVGINTGGVTGAAKLNIRGTFSGSTTTALGNVASSQLHIGYPGYVDQYSQITFGYDGANAPAAIGAVADSAAGQTSASLVFATRSSTTSILPTERMRINANGHITMPSQPKWLYSGGTVIGTGWVTVKPTSAVISSANFDTATGRFTAPVAGTYYVGIWGLLYPADATDTYTAQFAKNGATYGTNMNIQGGGNSTNHLNYSATTIIYLAAGDYVEFQLNTGNNGLNAYNTQWSQYGFLMG